MKAKYIKPETDIVFTGISVMGGPPAVVSQPSEAKRSVSQSYSSHFWSESDDESNSSQISEN